ncbi:hypothetical protein RFI_36295, partial [Reticulomyxa filosa]
MLFLIMHTVVLFILSCFKCSKLYKKQYQIDIKKKQFQKISTEENAILKIFCNSLKKIKCNYFNFLKQPKQNKTHPSMLAFNQIKQ